MTDFTIAEEIEVTPDIVGEELTDFVTDGLVDPTAVLLGDEVHGYATDGLIDPTAALLGDLALVDDVFEEIAPTPALPGEPAWGRPLSAAPADVTVELADSEDDDDDEPLQLSRAAGDGIDLFPELEWPGSATISGTIDSTAALLGTQPLALRLDENGDNPIDVDIELDGGAIVPFFIDGVIAPGAELPGDLTYVDNFIGVTVAGTIDVGVSLDNGLKLADLVTETITSTPTITGLVKRATTTDGLISSTPVLTGDATYVDVSFPYTVTGTIAPIAVLVPGFLGTFGIRNAIISPIVDLAGDVNTGIGIPPIDYLLARQAVEVEYFDPVTFQNVHLAIPVGVYVQIPPPANSSDLTAAAWSMVEDGVLNVYRSYAALVIDEFPPMILTPVLLGDLVKLP